MNFISSIEIKFILKLDVYEIFFYDLEFQII